MNDRDRLRNALFGAIALTVAVGVGASIAGSRLLGWVALALVVLCFAVYFRWRGAVRRSRAVGPTR